MGRQPPIARWRRREAASFTEQVTVTRTVARGAFNPATGRHDPDDTEEVYAGPGKLRTAKWEGTDVGAGEREIRLRGGQQLTLPANTPLEANDVAEVTASKFDADLPGRRFRITDVLRDGWQVNRRAIVEELEADAGGGEEESS